MPKVGEANPNGQRLKPQQQKFLDNYLHKDMTQTAAARTAGYNHPTVQAVQLLNKQGTSPQQLKQKSYGLKLPAS